MSHINPYLARFQDEPTLVSPHQQARFESCLALGAQAVTTYFAEAKAAGENLSGNDDDWWGLDGSFLSAIRPYVVVDGILQIPVKGVLLHDFPYTFFGYLTGYEYIWRAFQRGMGDANVQGIALIVDSPGGMVAGCFECVDKMYAMRGTKPVRGYAAEAAYSAAYAVISVSDPGQIHVTRTGGVGSIGVVTSHVDISKAMDAYGYAVTFIFAGAHKVDGNPYQALPADVKARIQARIDDLYSVFVATVARNRPNLSEQQVRDTEALCYGANEAVSIGLADKIGALDDALADFSADLTTLNDGDADMADITQAQYDAAVAQARADGITAGKTDGITEGATAERTRISAILGSDEAADRRTLASHIAFNTAMSVDDAKGMLAVAGKDVAAPAPAAQAEGAGKGKDRFDAAMDKTGNPNVGALAGGEDAPQMSRAAQARALAGKGKKAA